MFEVFKQVCLVKIFQEILWCAEICQPQLQQSLTWHCHLVSSISFCFISSFLNVFYRDKVIGFDRITNLVKSKMSKIILPWTLFTPGEILSSIGRGRLQLNVFFTVIPTASFSWCIPLWRSILKTLFIAKPKYFLMLKYDTTCSFLR